jgi:putative transposase
MKRSKFSEQQIISILKAVEAGRAVRDVCREHEISDATYYKWKQKYGGEPDRVDHPGLIRFRVAGR